MPIVIKRDGTEQSFDKDKLVSSMKKAGLDEEIAVEVAEGIASDFTYEDVSTDDIRIMVEDELRYYRSDALRRYGSRFSS